MAIWWFWGVCGLGFTSICMFLDLLTHTIHGTGIFTYMLIDVYGFHVGKYTIRPMDAIGLFGGWKKYNFCWAKDSSASVPLISFVPTKARLTQMLCEMPASPIINKQIKELVSWEFQGTPPNATPPKKQGPNKGLFTIIRPY